MKAVGTLSLTLRVDTESVRFLGPVSLVHATKDECFNSRTTNWTNFNPLVPAEMES